MRASDPTPHIDAVVTDLAGRGSALVAYSGGVDSAVVAALAHRALGDHALAVTAAAETLAGAELDHARRVAAEIGIRHELVTYSELDDPEFVANPSYRQVCGGQTGHAEVVRITFDPQVVSFRDLLNIFFSIHDPTTLNRQGADVGTQYRSAIFYHTPEQQETAKAVIAELDAARLWSGPIVTEVAPAQTFYIAEDYHQEYFAQNGGQPYCQAVVAPKVAKFRKQHLDLLRK